MAPPVPSRAIIIEILSKIGFCKVSIAFKMLNSTYLWFSSSTHCFASSTDCSVGVSTPVSESFSSDFEYTSVAGLSS